MIEKEIQNKKSQKKQKVIAILCVLILIVSFFGISYALWSRTFTGTKENSINTGYISFSYTESDSNVIAISNALPTSDENGKLLTGSDNIFDFTVSAKYSGVSAINYDIYLTPINSTLDGRYVKLYLTDQNDRVIDGFEQVPTYASLNDYNSDGKLLYKGSITESESPKKYRLRAWVSSDFTGASESKNFSFKVNVRGMA